VIGVVTELAVEQMRTGVPVRFRTAAGGVRLEGVLVECGEDGLATGCELVRVELEPQA
jgi:calcineurin-like phosphoesterase